METSEGIHRTAGVCSVLFVLMAILFKVGLVKEAVTLSALIIILIGISSRRWSGEEKEEQDLKSEDTIATNPKKKAIVEKMPNLCGLSRAQARDISSRLDVVDRGSKYVLIELDKVLEVLLNFLLEDLIEEYNRAHAAAGDFMRMTTGEKCKKLISMLEKRDALYTGPASTSLPRLRDQLRHARNVRNRIAHDANYDPPSKTVGKAVFDYTQSIAEMLTEFASSR